MIGLAQNIEKYENQPAHEYHQLFRVVNTGSNVDFKVLNQLMLQFALEPFPEF